MIQTSATMGTIFTLNHRSAPRPGISPVPSVSRGSPPMRIDSPLRANASRSCPGDPPSWPNDVASCPRDSASCPSDSASCPSDSASCPSDAASCPDHSDPCPDGPDTGPHDRDTGQNDSAPCPSGPYANCGRSRGPSQPQTRTPPSICSTAAPTPLQMFKTCATPSEAALISIQ